MIAPYTGTESSLVGFYKEISRTKDKTRILKEKNSIAGNLIDDTVRTSEILLELFNEVEAEPSLSFYSKSFDPSFDIRKLNFQKLPDKVYTLNSLRLKEELEKDFDIYLQKGKKEKTLISFFNLLQYLDALVSIRVKLTLSGLRQEQRKVLPFIKNQSIETIETAINNIGLILREWSKDLSSSAKDFIEAEIAKQTEFTNIHENYSVKNRLAGINIEKLRTFLGLNRNANGSIRVLEKQQEKDIKKESPKKPKGIQPLQGGLQKGYRAEHIKGKLYRIYGADNKSIGVFIYNPETRRFALK